MPNYGLVVGSKFKPFSYQELVAPVMEATKAHQAVEDAYNDLDVKASIWNNLINRDLDPELYEQYQKYADDLSRQAEQLAAQGLTPNAKQSLLGLKSRYSKEITPIENAYTKRAEQAKIQQNAKINNPHLYFSRDAANTRLMDYVINPEIDFDAINGKDVTTMVSNAASALSKELVEDKTELRKLLGGDYYEYVKQRGFTKEAVLEAIMDNPNASPVLRSILDKAVDSTGVRGWNDPKALERTYNYAKEGLWSAVGQADSQITANWRASENLSHSNAMARLRESAKRKNNPNLVAYKNPTDNKTYYFNPQINMWQDEDGYIAQPDTTMNFPVKTGTSRPKNSASGFGSYKEVVDNGFMPKVISTRGNGGKGDYFTAGDDVDLPGGNSQSYFTYKGFLNRSNTALVTPQEGMPTGFIRIVNNASDHNYSEEENLAIIKAVGYELGFKPDENGNFTPEEENEIINAMYPSDPEKDPILVLEFRGKKDKTSYNGGINHDFVVYRKELQKTK